MRRIISITLLSMCTLMQGSSYLISPFAHAIVQRIYYIARLQRPIRLLKTLDSQKKHIRDELLAEWEIFGSFKKVDNPLYEKEFIAKLFAFLQDYVAVGAQLSTKKNQEINELTVQYQVSTDDIAFRYFLTQRLRHVFSSLERLRISHVFRLNDFSVLSSLRGDITHPEIDALLEQLIQKQDIEPLLNEWEHVIQCKNPSNTHYVKEFLGVTLACLKSYTHEVISPLHYSISCLIKMIDQSMSELNSSIQDSRHESTWSVQRVLSTTILVAIVSFWVSGQLR